MLKAEIKKLEESKPSTLVSWNNSMRYNILQSISLTDLYNRNIGWTIATKFKIIWRSREKIFNLGTPLAGASQKIISLISLPYRSCI